MSRTGRFFGVGVGPGDRRLLTLRAVEVLRAADEVVAPKSSPDGDSLALGIARPFVKAAAKVSELVFPMTRSERELEEHWRASARTVVDSLRAGHDVAFITLGDPMFYSTYIYLLGAIRDLATDMAVETVPGVSAMSAMAAACNMPLGQGDGAIAVLPARLIGRLEGLAESFETVVIIKIGDRLPAVVAELKRLGLDGLSVFASYLGQAGEQAPLGVSHLSEGASGYMSTIIVHQPKVAVRP